MAVCMCAMVVNIKVRFSQRNEESFEERKKEGRKEAN